MNAFSLRVRAGGALSLLASAAAVAHADGVTVATLSPTVVTATRVEQPLSDVLPSVSVITRQDIERSQAATLADLLQGEAGFEFARNGGPGTVASFFLRGADSKNLVVLIDGVRAPVDAFGSLTAIDLPLDLVERIELLRGNAGALYGEAAVGGVLHIVTRAADRDASQATLSLGSRAMVATHIGLSRRTGGWSLRLDAGSRDSDGFSAVNTAKEPGANPDADGLKSRYLALRADHALGAGWLWGVQARAEEVRVAFDDPFGSPTDSHRFERSARTLTAFFKGQPSPDWSTRVDLSHYTLETRDLLNGVPNRGEFSAGRLNGQGDSVRWFNTWAAAEQTLVNFGVDLTREGYQSDALSLGFDAQRRLTGIFAGVNHQSGAFTGQFNVRHDRVEVSDQASAAQEGRWSTSTWLVGGGYRLAAGWRVTGTLATGFRAPSVGELSYSAALQPETYRSAEAGVSYEQGESRWRAVVFRSRSRNTIDWSVWPPSNLGHTRNQGLELSGDVRWAGQRVRTSLVRQNPVDADTGSLLARRARLYGAVEWLRPIGAGEGGAVLRASGSRRDMGRTLPGYATVGLTYARPVAKDWTVRLRVDNLFDRRYELAYGYNTPGRTLLATLTYQPKN